LAKFGLFALESERLDDILNEACRLVGEALHTDLAKVVEVLPDRDTLLVRAGVGWRPGVVGLKTKPIDTKSSEGFALHSGKPVISVDIDGEHRFTYAPFLKRHGVKAMVNVPIPGVRGRQAFGLLQVDSRVPRGFNEDDILFLTGYANLLASAVDRLLAYDSVQDANRELERRVAERTADLSAANEKLMAEADDRERYIALLRHATRLETVVQNLPFGAALVEPNGSVIVANPEFNRLLPRGIMPSADTERGAEWRSFHSNGEQVAPRDYPSAQARRGEVGKERDFEYTSGDHEPHWRRLSGIPIFDDTGGVSSALVVLVDIDTERRLAQRQLLLSREVDHRAKNMLTVVLAALRLTRAGPLPEYVKTIEGRVMALARAQTLLAADKWAGADLHALLRGELNGFVQAVPPSPHASLSGPVVALPAGAAQPFSMAIHELATNAVKYGGLSASGGRVDIHWRLVPTLGKAPALRLSWVETGGPMPDATPNRRGFGSRVLTGTLRDQMGGSCTMDWQTSGLVCTIEVPLVEDRLLPPMVPIIRNGAMPITPPSSPSPG
jgi:two-component sensor histidine kinase/PAS domain-containing protein